MNLKKLIQECCEQKLAAQSEVYKLYAKKLFSLCLKYSKNYQDAEDVLQDSFLQIFKKIGQFNFKGSFEGWIKRITINVAIAKYRENAPLQVVKESEIKEKESVEIEKVDVALDDLLKVIQQLPDRYRLVFNLYVLDEYSHKEIAKLLNISEGTSKSNLSRARLILKEKVNALKRE